MAASSEGETVRGEEVRRGEGLPRRRIVAELLVVAAGAGFLWGAWALSIEWLERRFGLQRLEFFPRERAVLIAIGLVLIVVVRPFVGRFTQRVGGAEAIAATFRLALAMVLAVVASEVALRVTKFPWRHGVATDALAEPAERYGWLFLASKSVTIETGGRPIHRYFNAEHNRAKSVDDLPDPKLPTIFFVGESVTAGHGLEWDETFPAIVGKALGLQVVNLAVEGYSADQGFLRLIDTLPRFEHPVAIVTTFLPLMVNRMEKLDHPRLAFEGNEAKLVGPDFLQSTKIGQLFREWFDYEGEWAITGTEEIFRQTERIAKERGARALFVTPYLGGDWPRSDNYFINELLIRPGFPLVNPNFHFVPISPDDGHPDVASTQRLADAIVAGLRTELAAR
jgi:hypothetical protein